MLNGLCAVAWQNYVADIIVLIFILCFTIVCAKRGFIECFFGFISTAVAFFAAVMLAKTVLELTGGLFGLRGLLDKNLTQWFGKFDGFTADISESGAEAALQDKNLPAIIARLVLKNTGSAELPAGTTLAMLLGSNSARLICLLVCGIVLFVLCKLVLSLLRKTLNAIADKISLLDAVNSLLGAIVGLAQGLLIVCLIIAILTLFPSQAITNYFANTLFVGALYNYNPLVTVLSWFI